MLFSSFRHYLPERKPDRLLKPAEDCEPKTLAGLIAYTIKKLNIDDYISVEEVERLFKGSPSDDPFDRHGE